jgi:peptidoglycan/xylan/chitin deacetylase (PgdA/CDA1 family)
MYHSVDPRPSLVTIPPSQFQWQVEWLYRQGYRGIALGEASRCLLNGQDFPERSVVLTFDDGFQSLHSQVFPILRRYGFSATVFLVAEFCGKDNAWEDQPAGIPKMGLLNWDQIEEMARGGIEFGSHTLRHPRLDQISPAVLQEEIIGSKTFLENRLARPVSVFAYPYGRYTEAVKSVVRSAYTGACSTRVGLAGPHSDPYALERIEIKYLSHPWVFQHLFHAAFPYYLSARRAGRAVRSALFPGGWK